MPDNLLSGQEWPRITIVTPSYNQGQFLEQTIRSILLQNYPNLEYFVMDGGSSDNSREIIQSYAADLSYSRSEKDNGQSDAINEGFRMSTGEILGWVNSDDLLLPDSLYHVGKYFMEHPGVDCVVGWSLIIDETTNLVCDRFGLPRIVRGERETLKKLLARRGCSFYQPASFWRQKAYISCGGLNTTFQFAMDYDLYLRMAEVKPFAHFDWLLACFRIHSQSKTCLLQSIRQRECKSILQRYSGRYDTVGNPIYRIYLNLYNVIRNIPIRLAVKLGIIKLGNIWDYVHE